jgi:hypothetical protein
MATDRLNGVGFVVSQDRYAVCERERVSERESVV